MSHIDTQTHLEQRATVERREDLRIRVERHAVERGPITKARLPVEEVERVDVRAGWEFGEPLFDGGDGVVVATPARMFGQLAAIEGLWMIPVLVIVAPQTSDTLPRSVKRASILANAGVRCSFGSRTAVRCSCEASRSRSPLSARPTRT